MTRATVAVPGNNAIPAPDLEIASWSSAWGRLIPLWRYSVWLAALFLVCGIAIWVRLDVKRSVKELDRNESMYREAKVLNERLHLEIDARRRATAMEAVAGELGLSGEARLVLMERGQ